MKRENPVIYLPPRAPRIPKYMDRSAYMLGVSILMAMVTLLIVCGLFAWRSFG